MLLTHVTLATGHVAIHRLDVLDVRAVQACRTMLPRGGPIPAFPAFTVDIQLPVFTVHHGWEPILTCALGRGPEDPVWPMLRHMQLMFQPDAPEVAQPAGPWLAVVLLPALATLTPQDIGWLGDFERCLAAAILLESE